MVRCNMRRCVYLITLIFLVISGGCTQSAENLTYDIIMKELKFSKLPEDVTNEEFLEANSIGHRISPLLLDELDSDQKEELLQAANEALSLDPYSDYVYILRSLVYFKMGKIPQSYYDLKTANQINPQSHSVYYALFYDSIVDEFVPIELCLRKLVKSQPDNPDFHYELGLYLFSMDDTNGAFESFSNVIQLLPTSSDSYLYLSIIESEQERYETALESISKAIELEPTNSLYYEHRAWLQRVLGNEEESKHDYCEMLNYCKHPRICSKPTFSCDE